VLNQPPRHPWHVRWFPFEYVSVSPEEADERVFLFLRFGIATTKRRWRPATSTGSEELPRGWGLRPVHLCVLHRRLLHRWLNDIFGGEILDPVVEEVAVAPICGEQWQHGGPFVVFCSW
jgi:hypothetical protein